MMGSSGYGVISRSIYVHGLDGILSYRLYRVLNPGLGFWEGAAIQRPAMVPAYKWAYIRGFRVQGLGLRGLGFRGLGI